MRFYSGPSRWSNSGQQWPAGIYISISWWELGVRVRPWVLRLDLGWRIAIFDFEPQSRKAARGAA